MRVDKFRAETSGVVFKENSTLPSFHIGSKLNNVLRRSLALTMCNSKKRDNIPNFHQELLIFLDRTERQAEQFRQSGGLKELEGSCFLIYLEG